MIQDSVDDKEIAFETVVPEATPDRRRQIRRLLALAGLGITGVLLSQEKTGLLPPVQASTASYSDTTSPVLQATNTSTSSPWTAILGSSQGIGVAGYTSGSSSTSIGVLGQAGSSTAKPIVAQGASGQSANLQEWQNSSGSALSVVDGNGNFGIGTSSPQGQFHISGPATWDVFCGIGPDLINGPAMNYGYSGATFGRGSGFFNVRPDASATPPNPSLRFMTGNTQRMIITNVGNVGIGTSSPAYTLDVAGSVHATSFPTSSDMRFKEDITPIDNALDKVLQLQGVYFKWNHLHRETLKRSNTLTSRQVGLIAQQVKEVLPEVVSEWADQGAEDYLAVDYSRLGAVTIEAIKELKAENNILREQQEQFKNENERLHERIAILERTVKQFAAS